MKEGRPEVKPVIMYLIFVALIIFLANAFIFPRILNAQVEEVPYTTFLNVLENGDKGARITEASLDDTHRTLIYKMENPTTSESRYYTTNVWPDDESLLTRLTGKGVKIVVQIPTQTSPILAFLISWFIPIIMFLIMGVYPSVFPWFERVGNKSGR